MVEFWTSIPLMALAALVTGTLLLVASVSEQRRSAPVPLRLDDEPVPSGEQARR